MNTDEISQLILQAINGVDISAHKKKLLMLVESSDEKLAHGAAVALHHIINTNPYILTETEWRKLFKSKKPLAHRTAADIIQGIAWRDIPIVAMLPTLKRAIGAEKESEVCALLIAALTLGYLNEKNKRGLDWLATHEDQKIRDAAVTTLRDAAYSDTSFGGDAYNVWHDNMYYAPRDISAAIPSLKKVLHDTNEHIRKTAQEAIDNHYERRLAATGYTKEQGKSVEERKDVARAAVKSALKGLVSDDPKERGNAAGSLYIMPNIEHVAERARFIEKIVRSLYDSDANVRKYISLFCKDFFSRDESYPFIGIRQYAKLIHHLAEALKYADASIRVIAADALARCARHGIYNEITLTAGVAGEKDKKPSVRTRAARIVTYYYLQTRDSQSAKSGLKDKDPHIRAGVAQALDEWDHDLEHTTKTKSR